MRPPSLILCLPCTLHPLLCQALLILEAAQQRRKVSALLRLAAAALYSLLGAPSLGEHEGEGGFLSTVPCAVLA